MGKVKGVPRYSGNLLHLPKKNVVLPHSIVDVVPFENLYVVLLDWNSDHLLLKRNVIGISSDGVTQWQIGEPPYTLTPDDTAGYTSVSTREGRLCAYCWVGYFVWVSPRDGSVEMIPNQGRLW